MVFKKTQNKFGGNYEHPIWALNSHSDFFLKFVFFEKATKFDEIFILLLTNKFPLMCFEFSVSYSSNLSGAP